MKTRSGDLPKPDGQGRIRPSVGYLPNGNQARFNVGGKRVSQHESQRRLDLIRTLFECQCQRYEIKHWLEWTREIANGIAKRGFITDTCIGAGLNERQAAANTQQLRAWGMPIEILQPQTLQSGLGILKEDLERTIQKVIQEQLAVKGAVVNDLALPENLLSLTETATFHNALDARLKYLKETAKTDDKGNVVTRVHKCGERIQRLKEHFEDKPLHKLDYMELDRMYAYWRNRPISPKTDEKYSAYTCTDIIKELDRALRWINTNAEYKWSLPRDYQEINRTVEKPKNNGQAFQTIKKETYTPEELATIMANTDEFGKALIAVCVNCAFGAAEIGQWNTELITLYTKHPHAKEIDFESTANDSWITGERPKTNGCYGEHLLWQPVARAIEPFLDGREVLPITGANTPWYKSNLTTNPGSKFNKWWSALIKKVAKKNKGFRSIPFGSLRDTLPNILRQKYGDDIASLALQHKTPSADKLLECYANLPFAKLFNATRELEEMFKPMLDQLK